jgi:hypothetical protein
VSPRRRGLLIGLIGLLVLIGAGVVVVRLVGARHGAGPVDQARPGPVVLVPGYGGSQAALSVLAGRIAATGRSATVVTLPGDGTGDLLAQVAALDATVRRVAAGAGSVDVIGYSAGGVVTGLWVSGQQADAPVRARRVITLGSPLHGAQIAAVGAAVVPDACPLACRQLAPGSAVLRRLADGLHTGLPPWLSVWTTDDQTVTPPESARLTGAHNVALQQICSDSHAQHGDLPTDPLVTGLVLAAIAAAPIPDPTPADCQPLRTRGSPP